MNHASYNDILSAVRDTMSRKYSSELQAVHESTDAKNALRMRIKEYLTIEHMRYKELSATELADKVLCDMAGLGGLEQYVYDTHVEEIDGNSWDDIEVLYDDGCKKKVDNVFANTQEAVNVIKRIVRLGDHQLDATTPDVDSYMTAGIRISAKIPPVIDSEAGVAFSIRKQRKKTITRKELVDGGTATEEMLDFLQFASTYGASVVFSGITNSGKTTNISYLLKNLPLGARIYTIEETRELDLVRRDADGSIISSVIHTRTRQSDNPDLVITELDLLRKALRFNPNYIVPAEMRGEEAHAATNAALTGQTVITSIHANGVPVTYDRICLLCRQSESCRAFTDDSLYRMIVSAFPITVYTKRLSDGSRRMMSIAEAVEYRDGRVVINTLWRFNVQTGRHERVNAPSQSLIERLLENGAPIDAEILTAD